LGEIRVDVWNADAPPPDTSNEPAVPISAAETPKVKPAYPPYASTPTQLGPSDIRFDFNNGARVLLPPREIGAWRVRLTDRHAGNILFQSENKGAFVASSKLFFVPFGIEIWSLDDSGAETEVFTHHYNATNQPVLIQFPVGTLGDTIGWFPYAARFADRHGCKLTCAMSAHIIPLLDASYPHIDFVTHEDVIARNLAETFYATYSLGLFFDDTDHVHQPTDFRLVGLHRTAGYILGVDPREAPPILSLPDNTRPIAAPYAVIAVQSSSGCKYWNNPYGWRAVVAHLRAKGLRVICIDQKPVHGHALTWTQIPNGAEDETGDRPLAERARWLKHAEVFVGLSSGLSWLAWAAGAPVVLISGFTHPTNEFDTPFRVINWHACNSCWNDPKVRFDHHDFMWCPRHAGTERQFECTRLITPAAVIAAIDRATLQDKKKNLTQQPEMEPVG
jgi:autotransporter strand-loop-strand O-heptosyltransferase